MPSGGWAETLTTRRGADHAWLDLDGLSAPRRGNTGADWGRASGFGESSPRPRVTTPCIATLKANALCLPRISMEVRFENQKRMLKSKTSKPMLNVLYGFGLERNRWKIQPNQFYPSAGILLSKPSSRAGERGGASSATTFLRGRGSDRGRGMPPSAGEDGGQGSPESAGVLHRRIPGLLLHREGREEVRDSGEEMLLQGDSGGGMQSTKIGGRFYLMGITSRGSGCEEMTAKNDQFRPKLARFDTGTGPLFYLQGQEELYSEKRRSAHGCLRFQTFPLP